MTGFACTALVFLLCAVEVLRRPSGSLGAGLLIALAIACALGPVCALFTRMGRRHPVVWPAIAALPFALAWSSFDEALRRVASLYVIVTRAAAWGAAVPIGALVGVAGWLALRRFAQVSSSIRAALALSAGITALLAALWGMVEHMPTLSVYVAYAYLLAGFASFATPWARRYTMLPSAAFWGLASVLSPERYLDLSAIFAWTAVLCFGCGVHALGLESIRVRPWLVAVACLASGIAAHLLVRALPSAYVSARGGGPLSGFIHSAHVLSDFDGDGLGAIFAQADCAPFDSRIGPHRHERFDNGIDDNCMHGDGTSALLDWARAQDSVNPPPPRIEGDIVIVIIDTLRYDVAHSPRMPNLQRWAQSGVDFTRAYTSAPFTALAISGILAGQHAASIELTFYSRLAARPKQPIGGLAPWLLKRGYATAYVGIVPDTTMHDQDPYAAGFMVGEHTTKDDSADVTAQAALRAWKRLGEGHPRFLLVHHMQVHRTTRDRAVYEDNAAQVDASLGWLRERIGQDATWVFVADHGEEFGEHGGYHHASTLYEEVVHVPLIFSSASLPPALVDRVSSTRAIMPTLMAALGAAPDSAAPGPYLCLATTDCHDMPAPMALELGDRHLHGLVLGTQKIIRDFDRQHVEAYDLAKDPHERSPLQPTPSDLRSSLEMWEEATMGPRPEEATWPYTRSPPWQDVTTGGPADADDY